MADPEIPEARRLRAPVSLSMIVDAVSAVFATPKKDIRKPAEDRGKKIMRERLPSIAGEKWADFL